MTDFLCQEVGKSTCHAGNAGLWAFVWWNVNAEWCWKKSIPRCSQIGEGQSLEHVELCSTSVCWGLFLDHYGSGLFCWGPGVSYWAFYLQKGRSFKNWGCFQEACACGDQHFRNTYLPSARYVLRLHIWFYSTPLHSPSFPYAKMEAQWSKGRHPHLNLDLSLPTKYAWSITACFLAPAACDWKAARDGQSTTFELI